MMIFSLVRYLHLMHCPEIAMCKSLSLYDEWTTMERTSDLDLLSHFIMRRMLYGSHQIFCNFISSDLELNITVGKLWWENKERRKCRRKEDRDTLHFKLQIDFFCREGENRFWCWVPSKVSACAAIHRPAWFVLKCLSGRAGIRLKGKGCCWKALLDCSVWSDSLWVLPCMGLVGREWRLACSECCSVWPLSCWPHQDSSSVFRLSCWNPP